MGAGGARVKIVLETQVGGWTVFFLLYSNLFLENKDTFFFKDWKTVILVIKISCKNPCWGETPTVFHQFRSFIKSILHLK